MKRIKAGNYNPMWLVFRSQNSSLVYHNYFGSTDRVEEIQKECPLIVQLIADKRYAKYANFDRIIFVQNYKSNNVIPQLYGQQYSYIFSSPSNQVLKDFARLKKNVLISIGDFIKSENKNYLVIQLGSTSMNYTYGIGTDNIYTKNYHDYSYSLSVIEESKIPIESMRKIYIDSFLKDL